MGSSVSRAGSRKRSNFSETNEKKYFGIRTSFDDPWISFLLLKITIFTYVIQSRFTKNYNGEVKTKSLNPFSSYSSMQLFKIIRKKIIRFLLLVNTYVRLNIDPIAGRNTGEPYIKTNYTRQTRWTEKCLLSLVEKNGLITEPSRQDYPRIRSIKFTKFPLTPATPIPSPIRGYFDVGAAEISIKPERMGGERVERKK